MGAGFDGVEEFYYVAIGHLHAAGALGGADEVLVVSAVNVNIAIVGIASGALISAGFEAAQPEDAGGDEVFFKFFGAEFRIIPVGAYTAGKYRA